MKTVWIVERVNHGASASNHNRNGIMGVYTTEMKATKYIESMKEEKSWWDSFTLKEELLQ